MLTCHRNRWYQFQKCMLTYAIERDHKSSRNIFWYMPNRNRPYYFQKCVLTYATETDHIIVRTLCWHMPQKQTIRFPEVHGDIRHRNRPKQFQKCMLTYHRKRPTCFRSVCWHTPQKQSIRAPELLCGTKLPMLLPLHINLFLECHIIYKLLWHFVAFHPYYQCCFLQKCKLLD